MSAVQSFRSSFSEMDYATKVTAWHKLVGAYFCHGYGGSSLRDILLGQPISANSSDDVVPHYLLFGYLLVNYSPGDYVYKALQKPHHPLRLCVQFGEAVDDNTTITGAFEKGARLHPNSHAAPYVSALAAVLGGGIVRYIERKGRGLDVKTEWARPTGRIQLGVMYIFVYAAMRRLLKVSVRHARLSCALFEAACTLLKEFFPDFNNPLLEIWKKAAALNRGITQNNGPSPKGQRLGP